ncbi:uncharacterized protein LOC134249597 [Saccostrea cucullata]|uniref:uncharacterized protein LOC134249597 n=1 Tax=Saccostrea cuccullata TaxID=36930 RepID=UPI002ED07AD6
MYMVQRTCMLSLENDSDFTLINPQMYEKETNSKKETICKGEDIVLKYTTEGTNFDKNLSGVLTYEVAENGENIAIFWGVWFKEDNQFNVEITRLDADQGLHDKLMKTAKTAVIETVQENGNGYTVTATMSNETKAHLRVVITNK